MCSRRWSYVDQAPECRFATQSGPMLVIDGELHPRFLPDSTSLYVRNGVGTSADGTRAVFAISEDYVTFHEFGSLFRDVLANPERAVLRRQYLSDVRPGQQPVRYRLFAGADRGCGLKTRPFGKLTAPEPIR